MNKLAGNLFKGIGIFLDYLLGGIIFIVSIFVGIFESLKNIIMLFLSVGGCLILIFVPTLMMIFLPLLVVFIIPILGNIVVSYLKYVQYMVTEYFYEKADYYLLGKDVTFDTIGDYGRRYQRMQEQERIRQEEAQRRAHEEQRRAQEEAQRRQWEEFAKAFGESFTWQFGGYGQQQGPYGQGYGGQSSTMGGDFVSKYEDACATLGVVPPSDKYEIKLAYRKMAKMYHPDVNKEEGATEKFQKINEAYEFLTDEAIERYRKLKTN